MDNGKVPKLPLSHVSLSSGSLSGDFTVACRSGTRSSLASKLEALIVTLIY